MIWQNRGITGQVSARDRAWMPMLALQPPATSNGSYFSVPTFTPAPVGTQYCYPGLLSLFMLPVAFTSAKWVQTWFLLSVPPFPLHGSNMEKFRNIAELDHFSLAMEACSFESETPNFDIAKLLCYARILGNMTRSWSRIPQGAHSWVPQLCTVLEYPQKQAQGYLLEWVSPWLLGLSNTAFWVLPDPLPGL